MNVIDEIKRAMAVVEHSPPPIWCYYVSSKVPTIKRQWRSDGRLVVWLPRFFFDSLKRHNYAPGIDLYGVTARWGTPVEIVDE
jgi:hypothetical protein